MMIDAASLLGFMRDLWHAARTVRGDQVTCPTASTNAQQGTGPFLWEEPAHPGGQGRPPMIGRREPDQHGETIRR